MQNDATIADLNARHGLGDALRFDRGAGGLVRAVISTTTASATVYLHGAHVTSYEPHGGNPILWMSEKSLYADGKAIRGGVPVIFPWFGPRAGDAKSPAHGFARLAEWAVESSASGADGSVELVLSLGDSEQTRATWPHAFQLRYVVRVGSRLELTFDVRNTGDGPFDFEDALHTYFTVADVRRATVTGLERTTYVDKVNGLAKVEQGEVPVTFDGETDRVYLDTRTICVVHDAAGQREIEVAKTGSTSTVVWNPWVAKAKAMSDFGDDEWPGMMCVETCNVGEGRVTLSPGQSHAMGATIRPLV